MLRAVRGSPPICVDVRQAVGGADAAEQVGVIDARGEDVHRLDQAEVVGDAVNCGIVRGREAGDDGRGHSPRAGA